MATLLLQMIASQIVSTGSDIVVKLWFAWEDIFAKHAFIFLARSCVCAPCSYCGCNKRDTPSCPASLPPWSF